MGDFQILKLKDGLSSSNSDLLSDFYVPCLEQATLYQRAVGYFSSSLFALAPLSFANFAERGGRMQIVCSAHLQPEDIARLKDGNVSLEVSRERAKQDLVSLSESDDLSNALTIALSSLIGAGILDLRLLLPRNTNQLFHDKLGIFRDGRQEISFVGSANETASAWVDTGNHENIEIFRSWLDEADRRRVERHKTEFEILWQGPRGWNVVRQEQIKDLVFSVSPPQDVEISLSRVREIVTKMKNSRSTSNESDVRLPKRELRDYQAKALTNWEQNDCRGIISFATGGGKTLTAIHAIKKWRESGKPTLVLVPSVLLHAQWISEIIEEIPDAVIIKFGANNPVASREAILREATSSSNAIVVATYATAATEKFISACKFSQKLLVIADEVHTAGQPEFRKFLQQEFDGPRLGLSATPSRYGDPEGTLAISDYFGQIIEPKFGIREAIESGALVPYDYDYVKTELSDTEFAEWENLSKKISSLSARTTEGGDPDNYLKLLLLKRARIAKSASSKAKHAKETIQSNFAPGDRWLIYCSDTTQLALVRSELASLDIPLLEYHQKMPGDKETTLDYFGEEGGLLLAIKCLDEGVDIPNINKALILASSTNPREYIQRRGRVLRRSPGKYSAAIWDTLVVNPSGELLTVAEAHRALMFSETSTTIATQIRLKSDIDSSGFGIDLDSSEIENEEANEE